MKKWLKYFVFPILGIGAVVAIATPYAVSCSTENYSNYVNDKKYVICYEYFSKEQGGEEGYQITFYELKEPKSSNWIKEHILWEDGEKQVNTLSFNGFIEHSEKSVYENQLALVPEQEIVDWVKKNFKDMNNNNVYIIDINNV